jgi:hypothetical protein
VVIALFTGGAQSTQAFGSGIRNLLPDWSKQTAPEAPIIEAFPPSAIEAEALIFPEPYLVPVGYLFDVTATHYGFYFAGLPMGCWGIYDPYDPTILAVGPALAQWWPCGTQVQVCGHLGCIVAVRQDSCPGCGPYLIDLSEAGIAMVCGEGTSTCDVQIQELQLYYPPPIEPPPLEPPAPQELLPELPAPL